MNTSVQTCLDLHSGKGSRLDIAFTSPGLARVGDWKVLEEDSLCIDDFLVFSHFGTSVVGKQLGESCQVQVLFI